MQISDLINVIEKTAPLEAAAPWDKSGMQVAAFRKTVTHLGVILDPTPQKITDAFDVGADFILSHHPLSMTPQFPDSLNSYHAALAGLFSRDVALYSAHTSLDANPNGPVRWLAVELGLQNVKLLEVTGKSSCGTTDYGFGFYGDLTSPLMYDEFCNKLAECLGQKQWRSCGPLPTKISRVACCPGSGSSMMAEVTMCGADIFITGDMRHHPALEATVRTLDVGHFKLEEIMMRLFATKLGQELPELTITFLDGVDPLQFEAV